MTNQGLHLLLTFFRIDGLGTSLNGITNTIEFCAEPPVPKRMQRFLLSVGIECHKRFGQNCERAPHTGETAVFRKAAKFDCAVARTRNLVNRVRNRRIGDVGFIRCVVENNRSGAPSVVDPSFELLPVGDRTGWIVWKAEIDEIDALLRNLRNKAVRLGAGKINEPLVGAESSAGPV